LHVEEATLLNFLELDSPGRIGPAPPDWSGAQSGVAGMAIWYGAGPGLATGRTSPDGRNGPIEHGQSG
jgi:hypothetical protein